MLIPPSKGFAVSVKQHNVELDALVEWLEGCITFVDEDVSQVEVADVLIEQNIYRNQDFAKERIGDAWKELGWRKKCLPNVCPFEFVGSRIQRVSKWKRTPAYSFCLMLALQVSYRKHFIDKFGTDYTEQGILFERLTAESLEAIGWNVHSTGWSKTAAVSIRDKVEALARHLGEESRPDAINRWTSTDAKDGGLDVVCHLPFIDRWSGRPVLYLQCASGENWKEKRHSPNLALWDKLLDLATRPSLGIAIPFALQADEFRRHANSDLLSLVLDRHRLCAPIRPVRNNWLSKSLAADLNKWTQSRIPALLKAKAS